jgi:hypothetical protein
MILEVIIFSTIVIVVGTIGGITLKGALGDIGSNIARASHSNDYVRTNVDLSKLELQLKDLNTTMKRTVLMLDSIARSLYVNLPEDKKLKDNNK